MKYALLGIILGVSTGLGYWWVSVVVAAYILVEIWEFDA